MLDLKSAALNYLEVRSMRRHRSRIGWQLAPRYSSYLAHCQRSNPVAVQPKPEIAQAASVFRDEGIASFWTPDTGACAREIAEQILRREQAGEAVWQPINEYATRNYNGDAWKDFPPFERIFAGDLGDFLSSYFKSGYKIFYGTLYRTEHVLDHRVGSQMWHSDGGPGICINVMIYLQDTIPSDGPLEALPWAQSLELFEEEKVLARKSALGAYGSSRRDQISNYYAEQISKRYADDIRQPHGKAGLVVPFLNNTLHRGGYPAAGRSRTAAVFHCYPSDRPTDLARYRTRGIAKKAPYPKNPMDDF